MAYLGRSDHHAVAGNSEPRARWFAWDHTGSMLLKVAGLAARTSFIATFVVVTWWVSAPDDLMSKGSTHLSAGDFTKFAIGIAMCIGMLVQLRRLPRGGEDGYRAWTFIGLLMAFALVAFLIIKFASPT